MLLIGQGAYTYVVVVSWLDYALHFGGGARRSERNGPFCVRTARQQAQRVWDVLFLSECAWCLCDCFG